MDHSFPTRRSSDLRISQDEHEGWGLTTHDSEPPTVIDHAEAHETAAALAQPERRLELRLRRSASGDNAEPFLDRAGGLHERSDHLVERTIRQVDAVLNLDRADHALSSSNQPRRRISSFSARSEELPGGNGCV